MDAPESSTTGLAPSVAAGIAVLFSWLGGLILLIIEQRSSFVKFYALQSLAAIPYAFFGSLGWVSGLVLAKFMPDSPVPTILLGIGGLFYVWWFVLYVIMLINAFSGKLWLIPMGTGAWCKRHAGIK